MIVLGIDPGGKETGAVIREGDECYGHTVITAELIPDLIAELVRFRLTIPNYDEAILVAVEGVKPPNAWHNGERQMLNPKSMIATAAVYGAVVATWPEAIVVEPGKNGSAPLRFYPPELIGPREGKAGTGRLRHCRSAWDVAGQGARLARFTSSARR